MNPLYPELAGIASSLLAEFGAPAELLHYGAPAYDLDTQTYARTETRHTGNAALFAFDLHEWDGAGIVQGDVKIYLERINTAPAADDILLFAGEKWRIVNAKPIQPAGWPVVWVLQGRKVG